MLIVGCLVLVLGGVNEEVGWEPFHLKLLRMFGILEFYNGIVLRGNGWQSYILPRNLHLHTLFLKHRVTVIPTRPAPPPMVPSSAALRPDSPTSRHSTFSTFHRDGEEIT